MAYQHMTNEQKKERIRQRVRVQVDQSNYEFIPEKKDPDYYDNDVYQRVAIYVRVSTDDPRQTTSYELQKKYYEEFVVRHPKWKLVGIYADEGISGTSLKHRDEFNKMISDCKDGQIDLIITKSVSRFARNVVDFLGMVRMLSERTHPIGVFFEAENIFSLNDVSQMALSFQATMAEEESRNKSRSMETSLRMRLDHGLPLTPKLLGFMHDEDGKLIINPETAHLPKLMFYMYLYGYSTTQIADKLTELGQITYRGNAKWSVGSVLQVLRNERYCGDVYTRKTFTKDVLSHKKLKNRGERPRSHYYNEHEAIISHDDFIAVQHMLNNSRYRNKSILPELRVIPDGLLKGFVIINPRWSGFKEADYQQACASAYASDSTDAQGDTFTVGAGDFDLRGFVIAQLDFLGSRHAASVTFVDKKIQFNTICVNKLQSDVYVELLVHPQRMKFAVRATTKENRNGVIWAHAKANGKIPKAISCSAFIDVLFSLFHWKKEHKYQLYGSLYKNGQEETYIFDALNPGVYIRSDLLSEQEDAAENTTKPISKSGHRIAAVPEQQAHSFGKEFYHEHTFAELAEQTKEQWQLHIDGTLWNSGMQLQVTSYEELRSFIEEQFQLLQQQTE